ncbi:hypothetical protein [Gemmatimonas sp.]
MRDVTGAMEFEFCPACGARRYRLPDSTALSPWAPNDQWRRRFYARRLFEAVVAAEEATHPRGRETGRRDAMATIASWLPGRVVGSWYAWTDADCQAIVTNSTPLLTAYADVLVDGPDRRAWLRVRAARSAFPRMVFAWFVARDAIKQRVARWLAGWQT